MFKISLKLAAFHFSGLKALEKRRALQLGDGTTLSNASTICAGHSEPECTVAESFAKIWFHETQTKSEVVVPFELLTPADVKMLPNDYTVTFSNISHERIQELYTAARHRGLIQEIARLEAKIEELQKTVREHTESACD